MTDEIKDAETRGYARGYNAGRKRAGIDRTREREQRHRYNAEQAFRQRAFLAALPAVIAVQGWTMAGAPVIDMTQRVELAKQFADESTRKFFG